MNTRLGLVRLFYNDPHSFWPVAGKPGFREVRGSGEDRRAALAMTGDVSAKAVEDAKRIAVHAGELGQAGLAAGFVMNQFAYIHLGIDDPVYFHKGFLNHVKNSIIFNRQKPVLIRQSFDRPIHSARVRELFKPGYCFL